MKAVFTCVISTSRYDDVSELLGRRTELLKGRLDEQHVLREHLIEVAAPLVDVPRHSPGEPRVRVGVDEQLHVEEVADSREVKHKNALEQDDVRRIDRHNLVGCNGVCAVIILIYRDFLALEDVPQGPEHEILVESIRMVEIKSALGGPDLLFVSQFPIEAVLGNRDDLKSKQWLSACASDYRETSHTTLFWHSCGKFCECSKCGWGRSVK